LTDALYPAHSRHRVFVVDWAQPLPLGREDPKHELFASSFQRDGIKFERKNLNPDEYFCWRRARGKRILNNGNLIREALVTGNRMPMHELETVIAIPPLPFRAGAVDKEAHQKNLRFLIQRNFLGGGRRRVIGIAGTSLVHHIDRDTLVEVMRVTGGTAAQDAVVLAGLRGTPLAGGRTGGGRSMEDRSWPECFVHVA